MTLINGGEPTFARCFIYVWLFTIAAPGAPSGLRSMSVFNASPPDYILLDGSNGSNQKTDRYALVISYHLDRIKGLYASYN